MKWCQSIPSILGSEKYFLCVLLIPLSTGRFVVHLVTTAVCVVRLGSAFALLHWGRPFSQHFPLNNPPSCHLWWSCCCHVLSSIWAMSDLNSSSVLWVSRVLFVNSRYFRVSCCLWKRFHFLLHYLIAYCQRREMFLFLSSKINAFAFFNREKVFKVIYLYIFVWKILSGYFIFYTLRWVP